MAKMRLADYVIQFLAEKRIDKLFTVSGGGIMFLIDAVGKNKKIKYISTNHEQGATIAAEAYARINGFGACLVTTGPGATNALTGLACAWYDSIPMMVISGQQKRELIADYTKYRNLGPQETNIIPMVEPLTKYAKTIMNPNKIRYELEKAYYLAKNGRPGPVWIDIPLDLQALEIETGKLVGFKPPKEKVKSLKLKSHVKKVIKLLEKSKRPVLILGNGVRLSGAEKMVSELLNTVKVPVILPFGSLDLVPENSPFLAGKFGPGGQRRGNFILQNSDLVLSIGASLNVASIGFNYQSVAPDAKKIMVNIDKNEMSKPTLQVDLKIQADAKDFIQELLKQTKSKRFEYDARWLVTMKKWKKDYPSVTSDMYLDKKHVNSYVFFNTLSDCLKSNDTLVTGIALDACGLYQAFKVKKDQRAFVNKNFGPMGWGLPAAIGASQTGRKGKVVLVTGDGSLNLNIQELGTVDAYRLPIKIFVFNNGGYESIRSTQNKFFKGRLVGSSEQTGVKNPDYKQLAKAYNLKYITINNNKQLAKISNILELDGPVLCEVNIAFEQARVPKASSFRNKDGKLESRPLEDMAPFLLRKELAEIMNTFKEDKS